MKRIAITPKSFREAGDGPILRLTEAGFDVTENTTGKTLSEEQMSEFCADSDGLLVGIDPVTRRVMESSPRLKAISKYGAGLDNIDLVAAGELGILVERAAGVNARSVAELAIGLFFALARNLVPASIGVKSGSWERTKGVELAGRTAGILGLGSIGRETAKMARGLGMKVVACDPLICEKDSFINEQEIALRGMNEVIRDADFLTLHLPMTDDTRQMINSETFKMMKPTAFLVNTSRGELVDEEILFEALRSGKLAGAASDVFSKEPPGQCPLLALDRFILTPHIGAYTQEANLRMAGPPWTIF